MTAFCTELGRRFGGTVADWTSKVHLRRKRGRKVLTVEDGGAVTVLEVDDDLSDDARLALIDLDIRAEGVRDTD